MISIKELRKNKESYQEALSKRGEEYDLEYILQADSEIRSMKTSASEMRAQRNMASANIGEAKKSGKDASDSIIRTRQLGDKLKKLEIELANAEINLKKLIYQVPNIPHESVPSGTSENDNIEIRKWGKKIDFNFKPKTHLEIGERLNLFDFKVGAKLSGSGFPLYTGRVQSLKEDL